jgi:hypothetical protein
MQTITTNTDALQKLIQKLKRHLPNAKLQPMKEEHSSISKQIEIYKEM